MGFLKFYFLLKAGIEGDHLKLYAAKALRLRKVCEVDLCPCWLSMDY